VATIICLIGGGKDWYGTDRTGRQLYPEAFEKEYTPASGLHFNAWTEGGT